MDKLLYITPFFNYPPQDGASLRAYNILKQLNNYYNIHLLTYRIDNYEPLITWASSKKIEIHFFSTLPDYNRKSSFFQRLVSNELPGFGSHKIKEIKNDINDVIRLKGNFNLIYFATQLMGQAALLEHWNAKLVIDLYDVYNTYHKEKVKETPFWKPHFWLFLIETYRVKVFEKLILSKFDIIIVTNDEDKYDLENIFSFTNVSTIPSGITPPKLVRREPTNGSILMVANYKYIANTNGLIWFYSKVWPIIKNHPNIHLKLVGEYTEQIKRKFLDEPNIELFGRVEDLQEYYNKSACAIIPLKNYGGTKLKIVEAMAWGIPIISTSNGAKGVKHSDTIMIADDPENFAKAIINILSKNTSSEVISHNTINIVKNNYTWEVIGFSLREIL